jgi:hypothetical protein
MRLLFDIPKLQGEEKKVKLSLPMVQAVLVAVRNPVSGIQSQLQKMQTLRRISSEVAKTKKMMCNCRLISQRISKFES